MYLNFQTFEQDYLNLDKIKIIEDENIFFLWKLSNLASSFWKNVSVLDLIEQDKLEQKFLENQKSNFTKDEEYGLLNRLDNATSWFLYFAKNKDFYEKFKKLQKEEKINKIYYAKVKWWFEWFKNDITWCEYHKKSSTNHLKSFIIDYPIMHKNKTKMIVIKDKKDEKKARWKKHFVKTFVEVLEYNEKENTSWLKITITKWMRHQIRVHLASFGSPIVWDELYNWEKTDKLYLFSVGIK